MTNEDIHRYVWNEMSGSERSSAEEHIKGCELCQKTISFMRRFEIATKGLLLDRDEASAECPSTEQLAQMEEDQLREDEAQPLREHTARCRDCSKKFLMLRGMRRREERTSDLEEISKNATSQHPQWMQYYERAREYFVDLSHRYSPGSLLGPIRIAQFNAQPALRGNRVADGDKILLEVPVGLNVYGVAITFMEASVAIDIAGYVWKQKAPATVTLFNASGAIIDTATTDVYGNTRLEFKAFDNRDNRMIVTLSLSDDNWESFSVGRSLH
jgi:hypothetical protein